MGRHSDNAREALIDAAENIVIEAGARHLTLESVAAKAGVSKGGLLYHFPNKQVLLNAMLDRRVTRLEQRRQERLARLPDQERSVVVAHVLSLLEEDEKGARLSAALLAAVAHDPQLLVPLREEIKRRVDEFRKEGLSFEMAAMIMLAASGLKFLELFLMSPFTPRERNKIIKKMIEMSKEETRTR
jgi:AcrR family transcriptional regulator